MTTTDRDIDVLELLDRCGFLVTSQIRALYFPSDKDGSVCRDRLRKLEAAGLIARRRAEVANPLTSNTMPVWTVTERGLCRLALARDNTRVLNHKPPCTRSWQNFAHYVCVSDVMLKLFAAVGAQARVALGEHFFEHTVVNADAEEPARRYKLYTQLSEQPRKVVCAPDAAFELQVGPYRRAYYLELERGTDTPARVAAKKTPGYQGLYDTKKFRLHFPAAQDFRVLAVAPTSSWRDSLRRALRDKPAADLWLFAALPDLTPEKLLHGEFVYSTAEGPRPLVRPEASPAAVVTDGEGERT
jgi:hypothetical protein